MTSLFEKSPYRNSQHTQNESEDRRVKAIAYIAKAATPREIAWLIAKAAAGDPEVLNELALGGVDVDNLRELLRGQGGAQILDQFRWTGRWVGTQPRLFILADSEERGLALIEREGLDPYRVFTYIDAAEVRRDVAANDAAGVQVEVVIIGGGT